MVSINKGECGREDGVDANTMMIKWKKERAKSSKWISSNNEALGRAGGVRSRRKEPSASTNTCSTSRKRVGLHGMVAEDSDAVDPATVPRKLRSAINKRSSQFSSPPIVKKKLRLTTNGLCTLDEHENSGRRYKQSLMLGSLTQDEEDVLEALCALSGIRPIDEQILEREDGSVSKVPLDKHAAIAADSEGLKEEAKHPLVECTVSGIKNSSSCAENQLGQKMKYKHACFQHITACRVQTVDSNLNKTSESSTHGTLLSENKNQGAIILSNPSRDVPSSGNGALQAVIALSSRKPDMSKPNGCIASPAPAPAHEVQQVKYKRNIPPTVHSASSDSTPGSMHVDAEFLKSGSTYIDARFPSSRVDPATEKVHADVASSWKKNVIHVSISYLIKDYQAKEKRLSILPSSVQANNEKTWLQNDEMNWKNCASPDGSFVGSDKCEGRNEASCKGRFMPFHVPTVLSVARQTPTCNFPFLSSRGGGASDFKHGVKSSGQLRFLFSHAQIPQHSAVPFPFTRATYAPPYTEKVVADAFRQSQMQVARFAIGNMPSHAQNRSTQQQIWQAHLDHSRPLACAPGSVAALQHERPSAASMIHNAQHHKASFSPATPARMQGRSYQSSLTWQELQLATHSSSSLSSSNHRQQPGNSLYGSKLHHEGSNHLQLLFNTNRP